MCFPTDLLPHAQGYQAGGLIGLVAVVPLQTLLSRSFSLPRAAKAVGISSVVGVGITSALLAAKATQCVCVQVYSCVLSHR